MPAIDREKMEEAVRAHCSRGDWSAAAETAIRGYGAEIFGFLHAFNRSEQDAADVFSIFSERVWKGLPGFAWDCTFRTWAYAIARNASLNYRQQAKRRDKGRVELSPGSGGSGLSDVVDEVRTATVSYLRTQTRSRIAALRDSLSEEDQMLLSLRLDRKLQWNELARVLRDGEGELGADELKRESARLRKRFQTVKERLTELARKEGLLQR